MKTKPEIGVREVLVTDLAVGRFYRASIESWFGNGDSAGWSDWEIVRVEDGVYGRMPQNSEGGRKLYRMKNAESFLIYEKRQDMAELGTKADEDAMRSMSDLEDRVRVAVEKGRKDAQEFLAGRNGYITRRR